MVLTCEKQFRMHFFFCSPDIAIIWLIAEDEVAFPIDADLYNEKYTFVNDG